jgi:hypothetical protein
LAILIEIRLQRGDVIAKERRGEDVEKGEQMTKV